MSALPCGGPSLTVLIASLAVDGLCGELPNAVHPVAWMGKVTSALERLAPRQGPTQELAAGALIALLVPSLFAGSSLLFVPGLRRWPRAGFIGGVLLLKSTFALRCLGLAALEVRHALASGRLRDARHALRSLCSRDASQLDEPLLVAAAIESVAENASDSFVAPLFYYALFGLPGAVFYRAVNTLDAMIGYHGQYEYLGKASARLDDALNYVPARITAGLLLLAGFLSGKDAQRGWATWRRDGGKTETPNAGRPMATMAGLLGIQLEKVGHYKLGDPTESLTVSKIDEAWRVVALGAGMMAGLAMAMVGLRHAFAR